MAGLPKIELSLETVQKRDALIAMKSEISSQSEIQHTPSKKLQREVVMIIDPQWVCRKGLKHLILDHTDHKHIVEAESVEMALGGIFRWKKIKFIIMELDLPGSNAVEGFEAIREAAGNVPILAISDGCTRDEILRAVDLGAAGFITKSASEEEILHAVHAVERGEIHISKALFTRMQGPDVVAGSKNRLAQSQAVESLTRRQRQVLEELAHGQSNRAIGEALKVSEHTVKIHVAAILKTLGVKNRTQAALLAQPSSASS